MARHRVLPTTSGYRCLSPETRSIELYTWQSSFRSHELGHAQVSCDRGCDAQKHSSPRPEISHLSFLVQFLYSQTTERALYTQSTGSLRRQTDMPSRHGREPAHSLIEEVRNTLQERIAHRSKYYGILATLVRCKLKDRVPPSRNDEDFRYDYFVEQRFPDSRGKKIDRATPPPYPYGLCEEECETCFTQYFPVRISVTDAEALSGVQALTNSINADLDFLRDALTRHADLFVTRWKKKSKAKRAEFLSRFTSQDTEDAHKPSLNGLYPNKWAAIHMINARVRPYMTRPDIRMLLRTAGENGLSESDEEFIGEPQVEEFMQKIARGMLLEIHKEVHHTTWLLPYLDVESLAEEPLLFLSLLYNRTVYDPVHPPVHIIGVVKLTCCRSSG